MAPSSGPVVHVRARLRNDGSPVSSPLRAASRWYVGHSVVVDTAGVCDLGGLFGVQCDERRHERPAVAYGHGVRDQALPLQSTFDVARRDVLAASRDDQVFLAIGDA